MTRSPGTFLQESSTATFERSRKLPVNAGKTKQRGPCHRRSDSPNLSATCTTSGLEEIRIAKPPLLSRESSRERTRGGQQSRRLYEVHRRAKVVATALNGSRFSSPVAKTDTGCATLRAASPAVSTCNSTSRA